MISTPSPERRLRIWEMPDIEALELMFLLEHGYDPDLISDADLMERSRVLMNLKRRNMDIEINHTRRLRGRPPNMQERTKSIFGDFDGQDIACLEGEFDNVRNMLHEEMKNGTAATLNDVIESQRFHDFAMRHRHSPPNAPPRVQSESFEEIKIFATVGLIKPGSPAQTAGLREHDKLVKFGHITSDNFTGVEQLAELTRQSVNKPINVTVKRGPRLFDISITPKHWKQPELIGCQVMKFERIGL